MSKSYGLKARLDYCEDPPRSCERLIFPAHLSEMTYRLEKSRNLSKRFRLTTAGFWVSRTVMFGRANKHSNFLNMLLYLHNKSETSLPENNYAEICPMDRSKQYSIFHYLERTFSREIFFICTTYDTMYLWLFDRYSVLVPTRLHSSARACNCPPHYYLLAIDTMGQNKIWIRIFFQNL